MKKILAVLLLVVSNLLLAQNPAQFRDGIKTPFLDTNGYTTAQIDAIVSPPEGRKLYDTDLHKWKTFNGTVWEVIGGGATENISNPLNIYYGQKVQPTTNNDGFYTSSANNNSVGYVTNATGAGDGVVSGVYSILNSDINDYLFTGKVGSGYYVPYLQNQSLIYASNDLHIQTADNTGDIIFSLGNTVANDITESAKDKVLFLNQDKTILAPFLSDVVIDAATNDVLVTKGWVSNSSSSLLEGYTETGTRAGGNLFVTLGDHDLSGNGSQIAIIDASNQVSMGDISDVTTYPSNFSAISSDIQSNSNAIMNGCNMCVLYSNTAKKQISFFGYRSI